MALKNFKTNLKKENEYPKLVRDNIPEIVEKLKSKKVKIRILEDDKEYLQYLLRKVEEEANELADTRDKEHLIEEVADVKELLDVILKFNKLNWEKVEKVQKEKAKKNGKFEKRILMLEKP